MLHCVDGPKSFFREYNDFNVSVPATFSAANNISSDPTGEHQIRRPGYPGYGRPTRSLRALFLPRKGQTRSKVSYCRLCCIHSIFLIFSFVDRSCFRYRTSAYLTGFEKFNSFCKNSLRYLIPLLIVIAAILCYCASHTIRVL